MPAGGAASPPGRSDDFGLEAGDALAWENFDLDAAVAAAAAAQRSDGQLEGAAPQKRRRRKLPPSMTGGSAPPPPLPRLLVDPRTIGYFGSWDQCDTFCAEFLRWTKNEEAAGRQVVLGFDIEWRVHYERGRAPLPTALVQLCDANRVYLFHVARFKRPASPRLPEADQGQRQQDGSQQGWRPQWKLPQRLVDLLRSPTAVKVGVNVGGDLAKLHWDFEGLQGLRAAPAPAAGAVRLDRDSDEAGFVELSDFANQKLRRAGAGQRWSLRKLSEEILSRSLPKPNDIRCGEWDRDHLTAAQAQYAAADAVAARDIFFALNAKKDVRSPLRPRAQNQREVLRAGGAEGEEEIVPMLSCPATARLRPSAMRVWERFSGSADAGAVAKIADDLQLKESTCWNYIADGILHGLPYDWAQIKGLASLSEEVAAQIWAAAAVVAPKFCAAPHNLNWPRLTPIMENLQAQVGHSEESTTTNTGTEVETIADYRQIRLVLAHRCRVHAKATV